MQPNDAKSWVDWLGSYVATLNEWIPILVYSSPHDSYIANKDIAPINGQLAASFHRLPS